MATAAAAAAEIAETLSSAESAILTERIANEFYVEEFKKSIGFGDLEQPPKPTEHLEEHGNKHVEGSTEVDARTSEGESFFQSPSLAEVGIEKARFGNVVEKISHEIQLQKDGQSEAVEKIEYEAEVLKVHDEEESFTEDVTETVSNIETIKEDVKPDEDYKEAESTSLIFAPKEEVETMPDLENPEIVAREISSVTKEGEVKMASEEVKDSVLERTIVLDEDTEGKGTADAEEQSGESTFTGGGPAETFVEQSEEETLLEDSKKVDLQELHVGEMIAVIEEEKSSISHKDGGEEQNLPLIQDEEQVKSRAVEMDNEERTEVASFEPEEHIAEEHKAPVLEKIQNEDNVDACKSTDNITTAVYTLSEENIPLAQEVGINEVSEDNEALKENEAIVEDKIEASREIAIVEHPAIEENNSKSGRWLKWKMQEAEQLMVEVEDAKPEKSNEDLVFYPEERVDEENETIEVKETQHKDYLEADKSSEVVLAEHASTEKGYEVGDGNKDVADTTVEETIPLLDVEVDVSGGEQRGFLKDVQEEPEEKEFDKDISSAKMEDYQLIEEVTKDISGKLSSSEEVQTSNGDIVKASIQQVEETNTSYTEHVEVNYSVEFAETSASSGAAEATNPPVSLNDLTLPELEVKAPSDACEKPSPEVSEQISIASVLPREEPPEETSTTIAEESEKEPEASEQERPEEFMRSKEVAKFIIEPKECLEDPLDIEVEVNGNTFAKNEEAKLGIQEKESETREAVSSEIEVPEVYIKSEYADEHKIEQPEKQPESTAAANDSICEDISNEGVIDGQGSAETSEEVKEKVIEEVGDDKEIHELAPEEGIIIEERDADLALVDSTEATDAVKEAEFINLETKEITTSGGESSIAEIERSKMQRQDSASIPVTEDAREETKEVILEAIASCDKIDGENVLALGEAQQNQQPENTESHTVSIKTTEVDVEGEDEDVDSETLEFEGEPPILSEITRESEAASEETPMSGTQYEEPVSSGEITSSQNIRSVELEDQIHTTEPTLATEKNEDPIALVENTTEKDVTVFMQETENLELSSAPGTKEVCLEKEEPQKPVDCEADEGTHDIQYEVREEKKTENEAVSRESPIKECKTNEYISEENELIQNVITTQEGQAGSEQVPDTEKENVSEVDEFVQDGIPSEQKVDDYEKVDKSQLEGGDAKEIHETSAQHVIVSEETEFGIVSGEDNAAEEDENPKENVESEETIIVQEEDASVLPKEELQEETSTIIQKIVEESEKEVPGFGIEPKECLEEPSDIEGEVNGHTHTENEAVKTGTQEKESETIEVSSEIEVPEIHIKSEDADDHKVEEPEEQPENADEHITVEPEKQPESADEHITVEPEKQSESTYAANDSICDDISNEGVTDEQGTKISEEIKEQVIVEVGDVKEIDKITPEEGTIIEERDVDLALVDRTEQEDAKKDVLTIGDLDDHEKEGSIADTAQAPESENLEIEKPDLAERNRESEPVSMEMPICDNQYEEPVSSGETTSDQDFPSVKLEDQIHKTEVTEPTLPQEQNEDPTTIVENIIEKDVTAEIEETENLELSSAAGTEEVCLEKEEPQKSVDCGANEGTQDRAYEVKEENKTEDKAVFLEPPIHNTEENELIHNVITTQEGQDESGQVHDTEKENVDEVNEPIHDGIPTNQKLDEYEKVDASESLKLEDGDAKEIYETLAQHVTISEERSCAIVSGEDNEGAEEDQITKGNVESEETIIVEEMDATEHVEEIIEMEEGADIPNDKSNAETVAGVATDVESSEAQQEDDKREGITSSCIVETIEVIKEATSENEIKENIDGSEGSDIKNLNLESMSIEAEEQHEIVTETDKFVKDEISTEEGKDGDREIDDSDTKLEGGEAKPIYETSVEQLTANKEGDSGPVSGEFTEAADLNEQINIDAGSVEAASESESSSIKLEETAVTQDGQITSSIEKVEEADELVKELTSEEVNTISDNNSDIKTADGVAAVIHPSDAHPDHESIETRISTQEATQGTETIESITEEGSQTNLKIEEVVDEAEKQGEIVTEANEPLQGAVSHEEVDNGHEEVVESESIKLEGGSADETYKISSRDFTSEGKFEFNEAAGADEHRKYGNSGTEENAKASESSNIELQEVIEEKEEDITFSTVHAEGSEEHFKEHVIKEDTFETRELKFEDMAENEPKDTISASDDSEIKNLNVEEISVAEVSPYLAAVANEIVKEGTDEAASESESSTVKLHEEEEIQEEKDTIEHVKEEIVKEEDDKSSNELVTSIPTEMESPEAGIASGVTFETREITREVEHEAERKEPSSEFEDFEINNLNLEEVTTVDVRQSENVIEANEKETSSEVEKSPASSKYKEAEDTSECKREGDDEIKEAASQSESSTLKLHEEDDFQEENDTSSALQAKDAKEHVEDETTKEADDKSGDELMTSIVAEIESPEPQEDNESTVTGIASSVAFETREITSEVKPEVEKKEPSSESVDSEVKNLNVVEVTNVEVQQFENAIEAIEKGISSEEVHDGQVVEDESESMKLEGTEEIVSHEENVTTVVTEINQCEAQQDKEQIEVGMASVLTYETTDTIKEVISESDDSEMTNLNSSEVNLEFEKECENITEASEATEGGKFTEEAKEDGSEAMKQSTEEVIDAAKENYEISNGNISITEEREGSIALAEHSEAKDRDVQTRESESSTKEVLEIEKVQEELNPVFTVQNENESAEEVAVANLSKAQEDDLPLQALELDSERVSQEPEDTKSSFKCEIENVQLGETTTSLVEQPEDEGFKMCSEQIHESKDVGVEVVDEDEAKLDEADPENGSEGTFKEVAITHPQNEESDFKHELNESTLHPLKEEAEEEGGLQNGAPTDSPSDAVISDGASQVVLEESEITHEAKSEIQSREILTGAEDVESETEPAAENVEAASESESSTVKLHEDEIQEEKDTIEHVKEEIVKEEDDKSSNELVTSIPTDTESLEAHVNDDSTETGIASGVTFETREREVTEREIIGEVEHEAEKKEASSESENVEIKSLNLEEVTTVDVKQSENFIEANDKEISFEEEKGPVSSEYKEAEDTSECIREYDETKEAANQSESSTVKLHEEAKFQEENDKSSALTAKDAKEHVKEENAKEADDKSSDESLTPIAAEIESPEAQEDNDSMETGIASSVAFETREITSEVKPEVEKKESVDSEVKNLNLVEATTLDVKQFEDAIEANGKGISSEEVHDGQVVEDESESMKLEGTEENVATVVTEINQCEAQQDNEQIEVGTASVFTYETTDTIKEVISESDDSEMTNLNSSEIQVEVEKECENITKASEATEGGKFTEEEKEDGSEAMKQSIEEVVDAGKENYEISHGNLSITEERESSIALAEHSEATDRDVQTSESESSTKEVLEIEKVKEKLNLVSAMQNEDIESAERVTEANLSKTQEDDLPVQALELDSEKGSQELENTKSSLECESDNVELGETSPNLVEQPEDEGFKVVLEQIHESKDLRVEVVDEAEAKLDEADPEGTFKEVAIVHPQNAESDFKHELNESTLHPLKEEVGEEGGLQDGAPKAKPKEYDSEKMSANSPSDAVISDGASQAVLEESEITHEAKSEIQSREILTGDEDVESETEPAAENEEGHSKESNSEIKVGTNYVTVDEKIEDNHGITDTDVKIEEQLVDRSCTTEEIQAAYKERESTFVAAEYIEAKDQDEQTQGGKKEDKEKDVTVSTDETDALTEEVGNAVEEYDIGLEKRSLETIVIDSIQSDGKSQIIDGEASDFVDQLSRGAEELVETETSFDAVDVSLDHVTLIAAMEPEVQDASIDTKQSKGALEEAAVSHQSSSDTKLEMEEGIPILQPEEQKHETPYVTEHIEEERSKAEEIQGNEGLGLTSTLEAAEDFCSEKHPENLEPSTFGIQNEENGTRGIYLPPDSSSITDLTTADEEASSLTSKNENAADSLPDIKIHHGFSQTDIKETHFEVANKDVIVDEQVIEANEIPQNDESKEEIFQRKISGVAVEEITREIHQEHKDKNNEVIDETNEKFKGTTEELENEDLPKYSVVDKDRVLQQFEPVVIEAESNDSQEDIVEAKVENQKAETENIMAETVTLKKKEVEKFQKDDEELIEGKQDILQPETISTDTMKGEVPSETYPPKNEETVNLPRTDNASSLSEETVSSTPQAQAAATNLEPVNTQEMTQKRISGEKMCEQVAETDKADFSLSDLLNKARDEKSKVATHLSDEKDLVGSTLELYTEEADDPGADEAKTDKEKDEAEDEHRKAETELDAPVMVENAKDIDVKTPKKHSNILSGVSSKVKHSISKVKKAIIGKPSNSKTKASKTNEALSAS